MANEIQAAYNVRGATVYAEVRNTIGEPYSTVTGLFAAFSAGSFGNYAVSLAEQGSSGLYAGDMPSVAAGVYSILARVRAGGSPAQSDTIIGSGSLNWTGTAVLSPTTTEDRVLLALPGVAHSSAGGLLTVGTSAGQINPDSGKVHAIVAGADVSGFPQVNAAQLAGQTVTAASGVTFPASVGTSAVTTSQVKAEADQALADVGLTSTITGRIDVAVSSRLAAANYTVPLDAAGVRAAVGLASANLDSQIADLPTAGENADAVRTELSAELAFIDVAVSTRASQTSLDTVDSTADDVKAWTDSIVMTAGKLWVLDEEGNPLPHASDVTASCASALGTYDPPTNAELEARTLVSADYATASALATVDTVVDAVQVVADKLDTTLELDGAVYRFTANSLELAPTDGAAPTAADIRAEIDANSTRLIAIEADTNELQGDWANGGRLDLVLDGRASQASLNAVGNSTTAIQAKTDNLPASPAAVGSAMTLTTGERSSVAAAVWASGNRTLTSFSFTPSVILDADNVTGNVPANVAQVAGQTAIAAGSVTFPASIGTSNYAGADTTGTTELLDRLTLERAENLDALGNGVPTPEAIAGQVRTELTTELGRIDAAVSSRQPAGNATVGAFAPGLLPANFASISIDSDGRVLLQPSQPGVTIPTVTNVTNPVSITGNVTFPGLSNLDAPVSSRLAAADFIAPNNATIASTAAAVDALNDLSAAEVRSEADAALGNAGVSSGVMARLDVAVSTRSTLAAGAAMTLTSGERTDIAASLLDLADGVEDGVTLRQALRLMAAALAGKRSGVGTSVEQYDAIGSPGTPRVKPNADEDGNGTPTLTP